MIAWTIFTSKLTLFLTYLPCTQITRSTHGNGVKFCGCIKKLNGVVEVVHRKGHEKCGQRCKLIRRQIDQAKLRTKCLQAATLPAAIKIGWGKRTSYPLVLGFGN